MINEKRIEGLSVDLSAEDPNFSAKNAKNVSDEIAATIEAALGLQMISIRLSKELLIDLKMIAEFHGIGYQPLMRDALTRFATAEVKKIAIEYANQKAEKNKSKAEKEVSRVNEKISLKKKAA